MGGVGRVVVQCRGQVVAVEEWVGVGGSNLESKFTDIDTYVAP